MKRPLPWFVFAVALGGCVAVNTTQLGTRQQRPPVPAASVEIYRTAALVPGEYEEVALLNASGPSSWTNEAQMYDKMRDEAGKLGANAIILDAISEPGAGAKVAAAIFGVSAERKGRALAICVLGPHFAADSLRARQHLADSLGQTRSSPKRRGQGITR